MVVAPPRAATAAYSAADAVQDTATLAAEDVNRLLCVARKQQRYVIRGLIADRLTLGNADIAVQTIGLQGALGKHYFNVPVNASPSVIILTFVDQGDYYYFLTDFNRQMIASAKPNASGFETCHRMKPRRVSTGNSQPGRITSNRPHFRPSANRAPSCSDVDRRGQRR